MKQFTFDSLRSDGNILILGCGGGFDIGSALPLWTHLKQAVGRERQVFIGGVQEPAIESFADRSEMRSPNLKTICKLTPDSKISPTVVDHPIFTVRKSPELCVARYLDTSVLYISSSESIAMASAELIAFCGEYGIQSILTVDTGIDSHVSSDSTGNLGDPETDCWTRDLLIGTSSNHIDTYLVNVCVGVETWISNDVRREYDLRKKSEAYRGRWKPESQDAIDFFNVWKCSKKLLEFEPSNTGFVLHQALSGIVGPVALPHSCGIDVEITEATSEYNFFKLDKWDE